MILASGDMVGIVGCSDGQPRKREKMIARMLGILSDMNLNPVCSDFIYEKEGLFSGSAQERGGALMAMYRNPEVKAIFDISGGNVANEVLPYLDFDIITRNPKPFFGYSDLSTILNSIYSQTGQCAYLYSIWNLVDKDGQMQRRQFQQSVLGEENDLFAVSWKFLRGSAMDGIVIGGNIRCFLKLAGTPYLPDFTDKILFLEAYRGNEGLIATLLAQLRCMGAFQKIRGIALGTFTQMEENDIHPTAAELVLRATAQEQLPVAITREVGHGSDSKCLVIGKQNKISA